MKIPYEVTDPHAQTIGREQVRNGVVCMSEAQAEHYLRMGVIRGMENTFTPDAPVIAAADQSASSDSQSRRRGRPRKVSEAGVTGLPPTNPPEAPDGSPPMPYLPVEDE